MEFGQKNFREIDLFDFTSFFGLDFFNFDMADTTTCYKNAIVTETRLVVK